jgi:lysophospholipase L1-like esterase
MKNFVYLAVIIITGTFTFQYFDTANYAIVNNPPSGETIVSFGDSLTYGTGASNGMDYPSQLSVLIHDRIINKGKPGDTTSTALSRIDDLLALNPRIVLLTLGGNDLKNGVKKNDAFANLKIIVQRIQNQGALVILGGIDIPIYGNGYAQAYEILARETGAVLVPNVFEGIMGNTQLMSDRIHPNDAGYSIMAEYFYSALAPYL